MKVSLIWAMSQNRVIGKDNKLPWRLPDELQYFRETVRNHPIILGRKTFESVGHPLKQCFNIVLSRSNFSFPGCVHATNLAQALEHAKHADRRFDVQEVFVIGGADIYKMSLTQASRLYRTIIDAEIDGDTFFPDYDESLWKCVRSTRHEADARHPHSFTMEIFERTSAISP